MNGQCNKEEGARLLETMRRICNVTDSEEVEYATLAYEEVLQEKQFNGRRDSLNLLSSEYSDRKLQR